MDSAAAMERRFAEGAVKRCGVSRSGLHQSEMAGDRTGADGIRRTNDGFVAQSAAEICQFEESNLRISTRAGHAAPRESRELSPRPGHEFLTSIRCPTGIYGSTGVLRR